MGGKDRGGGGAAREGRTESGWWIGRQKDTEEASFAQRNDV